MSASTTDSRPLDHTEEEHENILQLHSVDDHFLRPADIILTPTTSTSTPNSPDNRRHSLILDTDLPTMQQSARPPYMPQPQGQFHFNPRQMQQMPYSQTFSDINPDIYMQSTSTPAIDTNMLRPNPPSPTAYYGLSTSPVSPRYSPSSPAPSSGHPSPYAPSQPLTPQNGFIPYVQASPISPSPLSPHLSLPSPYVSAANGYSNEDLTIAPYLKSPSTEIRLGPYIPQSVYRPHTTSDRRRYVEEVSLDAPIVFKMQNPNQFGIPLKDALTSRFMRLEGRDDLMFENRGPSISIRLNWEGYQPWSRQIPTRDFRSPPGPITRSKLAKNVAKSVQRFIEEHQGRDLEPGRNANWRVGPGYITVDNLMLVSLHHVSMGSWQAHLQLYDTTPSA